MAPPPDEPGEGPPLDLARIIQTLDRHGVEHIVVGGAAALSYGAHRRTKDLDCVPRPDADNLERLAAAMRELGARLRAEGLGDEESRQLPVVLDARTLGEPEMTTWMTDAGGLDVLANIPDRTGRRLSYDMLTHRAEAVEVAGVTIRVAGLEEIIASKEWASRPKDHQALPELHAIRDAQAARLADQCFPRPAR